MDVLRHLNRGTLICLAALTLSGCQIGYLVKSAYSQADLLRRRVPIEDALKDPRLTDDQKRKLSLAIDVRAFAESELGLAKTKNYTSYVQLDGPYVTYVVSAAPKNELTLHLWKYPLVGQMPYKGFFDPEGAASEAADLKSAGLDTYTRGVSAYSTLGWFRDPVLSSMLAYKDHDLVNTLIHETVHATVFIKSEADFNERLAVFIGNKGTELFYLKREGPESPTLKRMKLESQDDRLFGDFMKTELASLDAWYRDRKDQSIPEENRLQRIAEIRERFVQELRPKMSSKESYASFEKGELNNARLLTYKLYFEDLSQFERVFDKLGRDFHKMLDFAKSLESSKDPVGDLIKAGA